MPRHWMRRVAVLFGALSSCHAFAQCDWLPGEGFRGIDNQLNSVVTWDPDGPGPQAEVLVAAGQFSFAGTTRIAHLAAWDGSRWQAVGDPPFPEDHPVAAVGVARGNLVAAVVSNPIRVMQCSNGAWTVIASNIDGPIHAIAEYNGDLVVAGEFTTIHGIAAHRIARWDGTSWSPLAQGVEGAVGQVDPRVFSLLPQGNDLFVSGIFLSAGGQTVNSIARWDGAWHPVGAGFPLTPTGYPSVDCLTIYRGQLTAGGAFPNGESTFRLASWDGVAWTALDPGPLSAPYRVFDLTVYRGELIAAADHGPLRWDDQSWQPLSGAADTSVGKLTQFRGDLVCAGSFDTIGSRALSRIARWDGAGWHGLPDSGLVGTTLASATTFQNDLIVGGPFYGIGTPDAASIARHDDAGWHAMQGGAYPNGLRLYSLGSHCLAQYNTSLAVADGFDHFLMWDGQSWTHPPDFPFLPPFGVQAQAMCQYGPDLYAAGAFGDATGSGDASVIRFDGASWNYLPDDLNGAPNALITYHGSLIAGGSFTTTRTRGTPVVHIARWDGSAWSPLGAGLSGTGSQVLSLAVYHDDLIAAGTFSTAGNQTTINIARWDGAAWHPLGVGLSGLGTRALAVYNDVLVAAGTIYAAGGEPVSNIAAWDGLAWHPLGSGIEGPYAVVTALTVDHDQLVAVGRFDTAGGRVSINIARWGCGSPCYANCDNSVAPPYLNVADFVCFLSRFVSGDPYANCDGSTTPPTLNVADFVCFANVFARGCP